MSRNKEKSEQLKLEILTLIGRFGWLRIREISRITWPDKDELNAFKYADAFLRRLEKDKYLQLAKLPEQAGTIAILNSQAIRYLDAEGIKVTKVTGAEGWRAAADWKHDLMTQMLFAELINNSEYCYPGAQYLTDRECKRMRAESTSEVFDYNGTIKVPDLVIQTKLGCMAIEMERAPKTGAEHKKPLVESLIKTHTKGSPYSYGGLTPSIVAVAFDMNQKVKYIKKKGDKTKGEKGVNHGKNIFNSVQKQMELFDYEMMRVVVFQLVIEKNKLIRFHFNNKVVKREEISGLFEPTSLNALVDESL